MLLLIVLTAGIAMWAVVEKNKKAEETVKPELAIPVHVIPVATGTVEDIVYVTGQIEPADRADVIAKIPTPGKLIEARVRKGDHVRRDQVLATVDRDEVGAVYVPYAVKSPITGTVAKINTDQGSLITAQVPVAVVINIDRVKVKTSLIEADLQRVKEGIMARVSVDAFPGRLFEGKVTRIEPVLDAFSHTAPVEITIENGDHALLPGMFAKISLVADVHADVPVVPKNVVFKRQGSDLAFVLREDKDDKGNPVLGKSGKPVLRIHLIDLKLGYFDLDQYEVVVGVAAGDSVVDRDQPVLKDRTEVYRVSGDQAQETGAAAGSTAAPPMEAPAPGAGDTREPAPGSP